MGQIASMAFFRTFYSPNFLHIYIIFKVISENFAVYQIKSENIHSLMIFVVLYTNILVIVSIMLGEFMY